MSVTIIIQNTKGEKLGSFEADPKKSIYQTAKESGINIPVSCKLGICEICKAKIITGHELIQIDKTSMPMKELSQDENGNFTHIFTCTGGVKEKYCKDEKEHTLILEKDI